MVVGVAAQSRHGVRVGAGVDSVCDVGRGVDVGHVSWLQGVIVAARPPVARAAVACTSVALNWGVVLAPAVAVFHDVAVASAGEVVGPDAAGTAVGCLAANPQAVRSKAIINTNKI